MYLNNTSLTLSFLRHVKEGGPELPCSKALYILEILKKFKRTLGIS